MLENHHSGTLDTSTGIFTSASRPPTPPELGLLRGELKKDRYQGQDAQAKANLVNGTYLIPNPVPQGTVPRPLRPLDFLGAISPATMQAVSPYLQGQYGILAQIVAQDRKGLADWIELLNDKGVFPPASQDAPPVVPWYTRFVSRFRRAPTAAEEAMLADPGDGVTNPPEYDALRALLAATIPDPDWAAEVVAPSPGSILFTDPPLTVEPADIEAAEA